MAAHYLAFMRRSSFPAFRQRPARTALAVIACLLTGAAAAQNRRNAPADEAAPEASKPEASKPEASKPEASKPDVSQPAGRQKILNELFDRLAKAIDEREAKSVAAAIQRVWTRSGSDTSDLLMTRAMQAMQHKDNGLALELLDRILEIQPDFTEARNQRATVRFLMEDYDGAMRDIATVLASEPRHFGALAGMGFVLQKTQHEKLAVRAFRRALEINPRQEEIRKMVEKLALEYDALDI